MDMSSDRKLLKTFYSKLRKQDFLFLLLKIFTHLSQIKQKCPVFFLSLISLTIDGFCSYALNNEYKFCNGCPLIM